MCKQYNNICTINRNYVQKLFQKYNDNKRFKRTRDILYTKNYYFWNKKHRAFMHCIDFVWNAYFWTYVMNPGVYWKSSLSMRLYEKSMEIHYIIIYLTLKKVKKKYLTDNKN